MKVERLSHFAEWPRTEYLVDEKALLVTGAHELPGMFRFWGAAYVLVCVWALMSLSGGPVHLFTLFLYMVTMIEGAWTPADNPRGWLCLALIVGSIGLYQPVFKWVVIRLFGGHVWVKIDEKNVTVKSRGRTYEVARLAIREIGREQHQKGRAEARRFWLPNRGETSTWRNAVEVVLWTGEQRVVIAEMTGDDEEKAYGLVLRLQKLVVKVEDFIRPLEEIAPPPPVPVPGPGWKKPNMVPARKKPETVPLPDIPARKPSSAKRGGEEDEYF